MPELTWSGKEQFTDKENKFFKNIPMRLLDFDSTCGEKNSGNLIVQGDNLEVLKSLLPFYRGQVKCIYIDPPYNTGAAFENYNDNFPHSDWLNMMYPRLKLLKEFLSDDGAIFISIDDNEQAYLKVICDDIFDRNNFITSFAWQSRQSLQNDTDLSINHEYIVAYAKKRRQQNRRLKPSNAEFWHNIKEFAFYPLPIDETKFSNPDNDPRGAWKADPFDAPNIRPNLTYPIKNPNTGEEFLPPQGRCWRVMQEKFFELLNDNRIIFGKTGKTKPQLKVFLSEQLQLGSVPNSWFSAEKYGTATAGTKQLQKIFGDKNIFDTVKPIELLINLFQISTDKDAIILDAFAGSGTTAHAVLNLNAEDGGRRKFILIEEKDYCKTITAERVRRVGGSFDFYKLGAEIFDKTGVINPAVKFEQLANLVWFNATKTPYLEQKKSALLGVHDGTAIYLLYNGILKDKSLRGGNMLTEKIFKSLPQFDGEKIIYAKACRVDEEFLQENKITFRPIPKELRK